MNEPFNASGPSEDKKSMAIMNLQAILDIDDLDKVIKLLE
jgi:hypothetical protein